MILTFLSHQWKDFWRSRNAGKSLILRLFLGFVILYMMAAFLFLGFALKPILTEKFHGQDINRIFCGLILYYFIFDWIMRFMMQELPVLSTQPYLTQNIRRRQIVTFLNLRSLFHFLNLLPLFIFLPFTITSIAPAYGWAAAVVFTGSIILLTGFNHFLLLYIKRKTIFNIWWLTGFVILIAGIGFLDYLNILPLRSMSATLFLKLLAAPWLVAVPAALAITAYINHRIFLLHHLYIEELSNGKRQRQVANYSWLQQWGIQGELIGLDLKLILRNKRPRYVLVISFLVLLYGFIFYKPVYLHPMVFPMVFMGGLFITGVFIINYGRFTFAWQSGHFDGLLSSGLDLPTYIRSKILLFTCVSTASFILASPYGFLDRRLLLIQSAAFLYNIGCNTILAVWFSTHNYKSIDLGKSATFNFEGGGLIGFVYVFGILFFPLLTVLLFQWLNYPWTGVTIIGTLGIICLLLRQWLVDLVIKEFYIQKYMILQGFRQH